MRKLLIIAILIIAGCSKEATQDEAELYGTWEISYAIEPEEFSEDVPGDYLQIVQFIFKEDQTFESFSFVVEEDSFDVIGYWNRMEGTFNTQGNRLSLKYDLYNSANSENDLGIVPEEQLTLVEEEREWEFNYSILDNNSLLKFDFDPCGPAENCLGDMTLERVE